MRTTIDMPDSLYERARGVCAERKMTFRALVVTALERALSEEMEQFRLRDASAGYSAEADSEAEGVDAAAVNRMVDNQRDYCQENCHAPCPQPAAVALR